MSKYSVMRIETAKQQCLKAEHWHKPESRKGMEMDWTADDEKALIGIFRAFDVPNNGVPTHKQLNDAIDFCDFSGGRHAKNACLDKLITVDNPDGTVAYKEFSQAW